MANNMTPSVTVTIRISLSSVVLSLVSDSKKRRLVMKSRTLLSIASSLTVVLRPNGSVCTEETAATIPVQCIRAETHHWDQFEQNSVSDLILTLTLTVTVVYTVLNHLLRGYHLAIQGLLYLQLPCYLCIIIFVHLIVCTCGEFLYAGIHGNPHAFDLTGCSADQDGSSDQYR